MLVELGIGRTEIGLRRILVETFLDLRVTEVPSFVLFFSLRWSIAAFHEGFDVNRN